MFSHLDVERELARVRRIRLPFGFSISISEVELCRSYLYHLVVKQYGVFNDAPIFHLPHDDLPLVQNLWSNAMSCFFRDHQACFYVLTDGDFEFPENPLWKWVPRGRKYGPIFTDTRLKFYGKRYEYKHEVNAFKLFVDVFTASPVGRSQDQDPDVFDFRFRALKIHNPYLFKYRAQGKKATRFTTKNTGPFGYAPDVFPGHAAPPPP